MQTTITHEILRLRDVVAITGLSRSSVYRLAAACDFPQPLKLSERSSGWVRSEVEAWIASRIAARPGHQAAA